MDKKLNEIKVGLDLSVNSTSSYEFFVLSDDAISNKAYLSAKQPKYIKVIYVDQFDDKLWKGYTTIKNAYIPDKAKQVFKRYDTTAEQYELKEELIP